MNLALSVYNGTQAMPKSELYGLTSQMRRAAVSIPANIAEGHAQRMDGVFLRHVRIALGSQAELLTEVELAGRLEYLKPDVVARLIRDIDRTRQLLHGMRRSLEARRKAAVTGAMLLLLLSARVF